MKPLPILLALLADLAVAIIAPNMVCSVLATGLFVAAVLKMFRLDPVAVWIMLPVVLLQLSVLVSLNFIEAGGFMVEMGTVGRPSTASVSYSLISLLMLCAALASRRWIGKWRAAVAARRPNARPVERPPLHRFFHISFVVCVAGVIFYLILAGLRTGFPLLMGMDRYLYLRQYADIITLNILNLEFLPAMALGVGFAAARLPMLKVTYAGLFAALMALTFLYAGKFFVVLLSTMVFLTPPMIADAPAMARRISKLVPVFAIAFVAMFGATFAIYSDFGAKDSSATFQRISDRVSSQGELWFIAVENLPAVITFDSAAVLDNLLSAVQLNPGEFLFSHQIGPFYFINKYSPPKMYRSFLHNAGTVTPTMVYEAYGLVLFGYIGVVLLMAITGVILALIVVYIETRIKLGNPFLVWLPAFILNQFAKFFPQASIYSLISVPVFKTYAAFLVVELLVWVMGRGLYGGLLHKRPAGSCSNPVHGLHGGVAATRIVANRHSAA